MAAALNASDFPLTFKRPSDGTRRRINDGGYPTKPEHWVWWCLQILDGPQSSRSHPPEAQAWLEKVKRVKAEYVSRNDLTCSDCANHEKERILEDARTAFAIRVQKEVQDLLQVNRSDRESDYHAN